MKKNKNKHDNQNKKRKKIRKILSILIGCPGSGKTYYAQNVLNPWFRISQDEFGKLHYRKFLELLLNGETRIVVDRMGFSRDQRQRYTLPAKYMGYKIIYYLFSAPEHLLIKRMRSRLNHPTVKNTDYQKHKELIEFFSKNYEIPHYSEYDELIEISTGE